MNASTVETYRRAIHKYLNEGQSPTPATRRAFAEALGVDPKEVPASDDEEEDLAATLQAVAREHAELSRRLTRALRAVREEQEARA